MHHYINVEAFTHPILPSNLQHRSRYQYVQCRRLQDEIANGIARAVLWRPLLLKCSDHLLIQVCLPRPAPHLFPAYPLHFSKHLKVQLPITIIHPVSLESL